MATGNKEEKKFETPAYRLTQNIYVVFNVMQLFFSNMLIRTVCNGNILNLAN